MIYILGAANMSILYILVSITVLVVEAHFM